MLKLTATWHVRNGKNVFVWPHVAKSNFSVVFLFQSCFASTLERQSGVLPSVDTEAMVLHDAEVVSSINSSVLFQLTCLVTELAHA